jgi:hypothetical protein
MKSHLILICLATPAVLALGGCAAGPLGALSATLLSLVLGVGLSGCYAHAGDAPSQLREEDAQDAGRLPPGPERSPNDRDGDGYASPEDCNDADPTIHPGAFDDDPCDGIVRNCQPVACNPFFETDADGDGYGTSSDCNDADPQTYPGAVDPACDGIDRNCDGAPEYTCNPMAEDDLDGDGFFDTVDCNDNDATIHPGAFDPNECDGVDENCDSTEWACNPFFEEDAGVDE